MDKITIILLTILGTCISIGLLSFIIYNIAKFYEWTCEVEVKFNRLDYSYKTIWEIHNYLLDNDDDYEEYSKK